MNADETMSENFYELLLDAARGKPSGAALIRPDEGIVSYAELHVLAARFATALTGLGVVSGDRLLVQIDKSVEGVGLYLGALQIGAVFVPINTAYTPAEADYFIGDAEPRLFVCRPEDEDGLEQMVGERCALRSLGADRTGTLAAGLDGLDPVAAVAPRAASDLAAILYTSGTTGRSKGAMLTHGNLAVSAVTLIDYWGWRDDDVLLHALPIFHVHGLFVALHCAMLKATPMIFLERFDADRVCDELPNATVLMGVPTFYTRLLAHPQLDRARCAGMRLFISGSAPLTAQTFERWIERTGHRILERYGMSETMMNTSNPLEGERVAGTVGFALPGVGVRIRSESGQPLAAGEVGVIEVKGPNVFSGYWRLPEKTAEEFRADGYFITGDLATMDERGRVTIVGRAKDLVISGGYNVYPKELEVLLDAMPGVAESAVIGVPHPDFGEAVVAVVVPAAGEVGQDSVAAALDGRIARFKQPKATLNVPELPRNAMGKVQKNLLRAQFETLFEQA